MTEPKTSQDEFQFVKEKTVEKREGAMQEDFNPDHFDETPKLILTSLIISGREISVPSSCAFSNIANWCPTDPFVTCFNYDRTIPVPQVKTWFINNQIDSLTDPEAKKEILAMGLEELANLVGELSSSKFMKLAKFCTEGQDAAIRDTEWNMEMWLVGYSLFEKLGMVRLGVVPQPSRPRLWVGRKAEAGSPQIQFLSKRENPIVVGKNFIETFIGSFAQKETWCIQHRGGLWRIGYGSPKRWIYIEEFDPETFQ